MQTKPIFEDLHIYLYFHCNIFKSYKTVIDGQYSKYIYTYIIYVYILYIYTTTHTTTLTNFIEIS